MIETHGNPKTNCLRVGVKEKELEAAVRAVRTSGYPLQRVVADCILNDLFPTLVGKLRLASSWRYSIARSRLVRLDATSLTS